MNKKLIDDDHNNYLLSNTYNYKCRDIVLNAMLDNNKSRRPMRLVTSIEQYLCAKKQNDILQTKSYAFFNGPG